MNKFANIIYDIDQFLINNIFLQDNKKNIVMDGKFTKIIYSDHLFMTTGIFLKVALVIDNCFKRGSGEPTIPPHVPSLHNKVKSSFEIKEGACSGTYSSPHLKSNISGHRPSMLEDSTPLSLHGNTSHASCKYYFMFKHNNPPNEKIINDLIQIEYAILDFYKTIFKCNKKITTILKSQLYNNCIKFNVNYMSSAGNQRFPRILPLSSEEFPGEQTPQEFTIILKISGIWEDAENIGLTYKFIKNFDNFCGGYNFGNLNSVVDL